jgi:hypothetical protein
MSIERGGLTNLEGGQCVLVYTCTKVVAHFIVQYGLNISTFWPHFNPY